MDSRRLRRTLLPTLAAAGLAASLVLAASATGASPGPNGRIFFTSPYCGVASVASTGRSFNCIQADGRDPSVAPNGRLIAITIGNQISVINAKGGGERQLTRGHRAFTPSFAPDNRTIAYADYVEVPDGINGDVFAIGADGSGKRQLSDGQGYNPAYSPDGGQIAFDRYDGISLMNADGGNPHLVLANRTERSIQGAVIEDNGEPTFSPDGRRIAFTRQTTTTTLNCNPFPDCSGSTTNHEFDVYTMNADGSDVRQLTSSADVDEVDATFSPDGTKIAYFRWPEKGRNDEGAPEAEGEIWVINAGGGAARKVADGSNPDWTSVTGGPGRPRLVFSGLPRGCASKTFALRASVVSKAAAPARMVIRLDGRLKIRDDVRRARLYVYAESMRKGVHVVKAVATFGPDKLTKSVRFRVC
jgi:dipeptidyl aminopeptidase/acylaminoacyl peptidase